MRTRIATERVARLATKNKADNTLQTNLMPPPSSFTLLMNPNTSAPIIQVVTANIIAAGLH